MNSIQLTIASHPDELARLNQLVEEFGAANNFHVQEEYAVYLCLEELVTNIINYAWADGEIHNIDVRLSADDTHIKIELHDDGIAFDPSQVTMPDMHKPAHERQVGGLGIHLVRQHSDEIWYERLDGRNILIVKINRKKG